MSNTNTLNNELHRTLLTGKKYNSVFKPSACKPSFLGNGDTYFTINNVKDLVLETLDSVNPKEVQRLFKKDTLQDTATHLHWFLYNHFQYKADGKKQHLRSAACSWADRKNGIDCKSFTAAASTVLSVLNIKHSLRKIKQPFFYDNDWTHIYCIIPIDQKTGSLQKGYYVVDGTISTQIEPTYTEKHDVIMSLPHYGLKRPNTQTRPLNGEGGDFDFDEIFKDENFDFLKDINFDFLDGVFKQHISCWGGSAFGGAESAKNLEVMSRYFTELFTSVNKHIRAKDYQKISDLQFKLETQIKMSHWAWAWKDQEGWNRCTAANIRAQMRGIEKWRDTILPIFNKYLAKYFEVTETGSKRINSQQVTGADKMPFYFSYLGNPPYSTFKIYSYKPKAGLKLIPAFEFTAPLIQALKSPAGFNIDKFFDSLKKPADILIKSETTQPNNNQTVSNIDTNKKTNIVKTAGIGIAAIAAIAIGTKMLKDKTQKNAHRIK